MVTSEIEVLDSGAVFTLREVCERCGMNAELVLEFVDYGIVEPEGEAQPLWQFAPSQLHRLNRAMRLQRDLDINLPGLALALDLLDELEATRTEMESLKQQLGLV